MQPRFTTKIDENVPLTKEEPSEHQKIWGAWDAKYQRFFGNHRNYQDSISNWTNHLNEVYPW